MAVKVAINGFGRIGRLAFRQMFGAEGYEVVAINDLTSPKMLAHLLKYDSSQGTYEKAATVKAGEDSITVDGKEIKIYAFPDANNCPWGEIGVDVVLECSGFYTSKEKAQADVYKRQVLSKVKPALFDNGLSKIIDWFSVLDRFNDFCSGILNASSIVYYVSFIAVFLFLTMQGIEKRRWN